MAHTQPETALVGRDTKNGSAAVEARDVTRRYGEGETAVDARVVALTPEQRDLDPVRRPMSELVAGPALVCRRTAYHALGAALEISACAHGFHRSVPPEVT
jgi:hypothetical protein